MSERRCVCGDPPGAHRPVLMSVPLHATNPPRYVAEGSRINSVAYNTNRQATYSREECGCGCCEYLPGD